MSLFERFSTKSDAVVWTNTYLLCLASRLAYFSKFTVERTLVNLGLSEPMFLSGTDRKNKIDTQAFVASGARSVFVVFRGTEPKDLRDWITDAKVRQVKRSLYKGKVHRGFAGALQLLWPEVINEVHARLREGAQKKGIWVAGHSLGRALATLATQRFRLTGYPVRALYTYGCPRVGNQDFKRAFKVPAYRFENNNDVVPKVPPERTLTYKYEHVCAPLYFGRDGRLLQNPSSRQRREDMFFGGIHAILEPGVDGIKDHGLDRYAALIKQQIRDASIRRTMRTPWKGFWINTRALS